MEQSTPQTNGAESGEPESKVGSQEPNKVGLRLCDTSRGFIKNFKHSNLQAKAS